MCCWKISFFKKKIFETLLSNGIKNQINMKVKKSHVTLILMYSHVNIDFNNVECEMNRELMRKCYPRQWERNLHIFNSPWKNVKWCEKKIKINFSTKVLSWRAKYSSHDALLPPSFPFTGLKNSLKLEREGVRWTIFSQLEWSLDFSLKSLRSHENKKNEIFRSIAFSCLFLYHKTHLRVWREENQIYCVGT